MAQYASNGQASCRGLPDFQVLVEQENLGDVPSVSYIRSVTLVLPGVVTLKIGLNRQRSVVSICSPY